MTVRQQLGLPSTLVALTLLVVLVAFRIEPAWWAIVVILVQQVLHRWIDPIPLLGPDWPADPH